MTGKTVTKTTTITTTTKNYEVDAKVEMKPTANSNNNKLDGNVDGTILSSSPSPTMRALAYEAGGGGSGGPKLVEFEILYDNPSAVFTGGDTITGKLRIALRDTMKMRLIKLHFKGRAGVGWSESKLTKDGGAAKQQCKNEKVFYDKEIVLLERRPGQEFPAEFVLPAGIHVLPFIFPLPKNLPTSFEGDHGSVRYYSRATIVKPWKYDHTTKRAFTVLSPQSAVHDPALMKPTAASDRTTLTSLCCLTGHLACEISVPKQVYAPGEMITVGAKISNLSRRQVSKAIVTLVQLATYRIPGVKEGMEKSVTNGRVVAERVFEKPLRDGKVQWNQEGMFRVPSTAPTFIDDSIGNVRIEYELRVELIVAGGKPTECLAVRLPVTIVLASSPAATTNGGAAISANKSTKYVDAVFGRSSIREDDENQYIRGQLEFSPVYPVLDN